MSESGAEKEDTSTPEGLKELGNKAFAKKDFEKAIEYYTKAIQIDRNNHVFFSNRSASYAGLKQWQKAAQDAKECLRLDPGFVKGYYRLATAQTELQDYTAALATVRQGLQVENGGGTNSANNSSPLTKQLRILQQLQKRQQIAKQQQQQQSSENTNSAPSFPGAGNLDAATNRELQELQQQYTQTRRELAILQNSIQSCQREYKIAELTKEELEQDFESSTNKDAKCYQSIGRMFLQSTRQDMLEYMDEKISSGQKRDEEMTNKAKYLEKRIESQQQNMQELTKA